MPLSPTLKAAIWMVGALFSFLALALAGRELGGAMSVVQIQFFRSAMGVLVVGGLAWRAGWETVRPRSFGTHVVRNVANFTGQVGWFYGLTVIPLAQVFAIEFTAPVWTAALAMLILAERMTRARALALGLGVAGILLILRPGMGVASVPALIVLGAAVCFGLTHTLTKRLTRDNSALCILFWMTAMQLPLGFALALPDWTWPATAAAWGWTLTVGLTALSAHFCIAKAMTQADATVVVPMDFLRLPLITAVGLLAYGEAFDPWLLAGAGLILVGVLQNLHAERRG